MRSLLFAACLIVFGVGATSLATRADEPRPRDPGAAADVQDVIFLGKSRPVMLRLHLNVDGKPFSQGWDDYLRKLFRYADRDGNGYLDREEIKRLPPAALMQNMIRGNFYNIYNMPLVTMTEL